MLVKPEQKLLYVEMMIAITSTRTRTVRVARRFSLAPNRQAAMIAPMLG